MLNLRIILEELVKDPELKKYPRSYNPIIIEEAEQKIKEWMLEEKEIGAIIIDNFPRLSPYTIGVLSTFIHLAMLKKLEEG